MYTRLVAIPYGLYDPNGEHNKSLSLYIYSYTNFIHFKRYVLVRAAVEEATTKWSTVEYSGSYHSFPPSHRQPSLANPPPPPYHKTLHHPSLSKTVCGLIKTCYIQLRTSRPEYQKHPLNIHRVNILFLAFSFVRRESTRIKYRNVTKFNNQFVV